MADQALPSRLQTKTTFQQLQVQLARQYMGMVWYVVQAAHLRSQSCHFLVHHNSVEEVEVRKRASDGAHMTKLWVKGINARA